MTTCLATCTKNIHSLSKATYSFKTDHEQCSGIRVNGSYYRFTGLADSNNIDVDVHVGTKGPYFISTDTVNGIYFNAIGVLTDTGDYTFHLTGYGIPEKKEVTHLTFLSDQSICSVDIPVFDYSDTINISEYAWEFYDNGVYHHGHVDTASLNQDYILIFVLFHGPESTNSQAVFGLRLMGAEQLKPITLTDSISHSFGFTVDQQLIFSTYRKESTLIIDSYNQKIGDLKGRFSWTGINDEGVLHEVKDGKFHVRLNRVSK